MASYIRITLKERHLIAQHLRQGSGISHVARLLNRSKSSVSAEVRRAGMDKTTYCPLKAQHDADRLHREKPKNRKIQGALKELIELLLVDLRLSPEQISGYLKRKNINISHEAIYRWVYIHPKRELLTRLL